MQYLLKVTMLAAIFLLQLQYKQGCQQLTCFQSKYFTGSSDGLANVPGSGDGLANVPSFSPSEGRLYRQELLVWKCN